MIFRLKFLVVLLIFITFFPTVLGQAEVSSHNITFQLGPDVSFVTEEIVFINPEDSDVHTFDERITILRGKLEDFTIMGATGSINDNGVPNIIYIDFNDSPIFASSTHNSRLVRLSYLTRDFTSTRNVADLRYSTFSGNILLPLSQNLKIESTLISIKAENGFQYSQIDPPANVDNGQIVYSLPGDERSVSNILNVKIEYAPFKEKALLNIKTAKDKIEEAKIAAEDADSAILNAQIYDANTTKSLTALNNSLALLIGSINDLGAAESSLSREDSYNAYLLSSSALDLAQRSHQSALSSAREANFQLRNALNLKIIRLENLTSTTPPPPTTSPPVTSPPSEPPKEVIVEEELPTITPEPPFVTPIPPIDPIEKRGNGFTPLFILLLASLLIILGIGILKGKKKKTPLRQSGVTDFRSISDLKKKSYKDFDEKVDFVKKETTIAGEIRKLSMAKKKFELGIKNLNQKNLSGEVDTKIYKEEKKKFESSISKLDKRIKTLEKKISKKGGENEKSIPDRPKKSR